MPEGAALDEARVLYRLVKALRRALYLQAGVWAVGGMGLLIAPRFLLVSLFGQPTYPDYAWFRLLGIEQLGLAMVMVLVGHRVRELWWWSWAFALVTVGVAAVLLLNAAFGLEAGESGGLWWALSAITVGLALNLLYGLLATSQENPIL